MVPALSHEVTHSIVRHNSHTTPADTNVLVGCSIVQSPTLGLLCLSVLLANSVAFLVTITNPINASSQSTAELMAPYLSAENRVIWSVSKRSLSNRGTDFPRSADTMALSLAS